MASRSRDDAVGLPEDPLGLGCIFLYQRHEFLRRCRLISRR